MPSLEIRTPSETSLVGWLADERDRRCKVILGPTHAVIILTHVVRSLNLVKAETLADLEVRRESAALLEGLRIEIQRQSLTARS